MNALGIDTADIGFVIFWLERRGIEATDDLVDRIFAAAKASSRTLTGVQVPTIVDQAREVRQSLSRIAQRY